MIKVGIIGGTGYTGVELLRLLAVHPGVRLSAITSRAETGRPVADLFPSLRGHVGLVFTEPATKALGDCNVVFSATPNGVAMTHARALLEAGVRFIDLAADFRLKDDVQGGTSVAGGTTPGMEEVEQRKEQLPRKPGATAALWEKWYGIEHACPELLEEAVYGLPEVNRDKIRTARLIANPGCYPTAVQLGFLPLLEAGVIESDCLIADCKSGISGAGRGAKVDTLFAEVADNLKAYRVSGHRHLPEITQGLETLRGGTVRLTFVPHLTPMIRGIHATLYGRLTREIELQDLYQSRYAEEPFVDVMPAGSHPETRTVRGANHCRLAVHRPQGGDIVVVLSVIDNLVKGAAGQAVQNMNIMFGLEETSGLTQAGLLP